MKKLTKIVMAILFVQLFNLNAADNGEYTDFNLQFLPQDMKNEILGFLGNPNAIPESQTLEKIKELQKLALVNKDLSKLAQDALRKYEKRTNEYLNGLTEAGTNPLEAALTLNTPFAAKWLKDKAAEIEPLQQEINKSFIENTQNSNQENIKFLINAGADLNIKSRAGYTALILATIRGYKDIVKLLVNADAGLNIKSIAGNTALILAAIWGYKDIVNMLISAGADLNIQNKKGETALDIAKEKHNWNVVKLLEEAKSKKS